jgi:hypothetical protein
MPECRHVWMHPDIVRATDVHAVERAVGVPHVQVRRGRRQRNRDHSGRGHDEVICGDDDITDMYVASRAAAPSFQPHGSRPCEGRYGRWLTSTSINTPAAITDTVKRNASSVVTVFHICSCWPGVVCCHCHSPVLSAVVMCDVVPAVRAATRGMMIREGTQRKQ